jgi:hypothetical protein
MKKLILTFAILSSITTVAFASDPGVKRKISGTDSPTPDPSQSPTRTPYCFLVTSPSQTIGGTAYYSFQLQVRPFGTNEVQTVAEGGLEKVVRIASKMLDNETCAILALDIKDPANSK